MTRFTGDSFKITPISIEGKSINKETDKKVIYDKISTILGGRQYDPKNTPSKGWIPFQNFKKRDSISFIGGFKSIKLPNKIEILPATGVTDIENTNLKNLLNPSHYSRLSPAEKFHPKSVDFIFFKKNPLYCLMSTTTPKGVDIANKEFLLNVPFTDHSLTFNINPSEFFIPQDLILWLLFKHIEAKGKISDNLTITDISKLYGTGTAPVFVKYEGSSCAEYLQELKFSVFKQRSFYTIEFIIRSAKDLFQFELNNNGNVEFKPSQCEFCEDEQDENLNNLSKTMEIYNTIIPELKTIYSADKLWETETRGKFRKKCQEECTKTSEA
jgi:hypothetical protein